MQKTQRDLQMTHNDKDLEKIYQEIFEDALKYMENYEVQAVAATYMAVAMRLYKTNLTEKGFLEMIRAVMETEIEPYEPKKVLH
jgi:glutamate dehydrogenase/leucine dehydrogenase